jgi:hypothetical protein
MHMAIEVTAAGVAELVDALVLGTSVEKCGGSSPSARTILELRWALAHSLHLPALIGTTVKAEAVDRLAVRASCTKAHLFVRSIAP